MACSIAPSAAMEPKTVEWARIRYLEGEFLDKIETISVRRLRKTFVSTTFDKSKKYFMDDSTKVQILHLATTLEEMEEKIQKSARTRKIPVNQLTTESEADPKPSTSGSKSSKFIQSSANGRASQEKRDYDFAKLINMKVENIQAMREKIKAKANQKKQSSVIDEKTDDESMIKKMDNKIKKRPLSTTVYSESATCSSDPKMSRFSESDGKGKNTELDMDNTNNNQSENNISVNFDSTKSANGRVEESSTSNDKTMIELTNKIENQQKKWKELKEKYDKVKKEKEKFKKKYDALTEDYANLLKNKQETDALNHNLQTVVIDYFEEQKIVEKQIKDSAVNPTIDPYNLPIGHKYQNGDIHLGNGFRHPQEVMTNVLCSSIKPGQLVGNLLFSVFGEKTLLESTRTGNNSNKSAKEKLGKQFKPLEKGKLLAVKSYFGHWLKTSYLEFLDDQERKIFDASKEFMKFNSYVMTKISNLKRVREESKKDLKKKRDKSKSPEVDQHENTTDSTALNRIDSLLFVEEKNDADTGSEVSVSELFSEYEEDDDSLETEQSDK
ncbi:DNA ligase 1-like [Phymastichus coffea]|uniref:DNA ligase 1-like n=1 Tax=Phymastichus coffea TaxID=108790 RepID=UPI00273BEE9E|nr:DNA ligase 1-like [Phymastichus coffea]